MATIRERGSYQWQAQVIRKGFPSQYKTFNNKSDAEKWARLIESEMDRGVFVSRKEAENTTLAEALDRYEQEVSQGKKGYSKEKDKIDHWRKSFLGSLFLGTIRSSDLSKWRDERLKSTSPATVNRLLNLLSHVFTVAAQDWGMGGLINPVQNVRRPKNPPARERRLFPGEMERVIAATGSQAIGDVIWFAIETGMRRKEIAQMKWADVDLKEGILRIPDTKTDPRVIPLSTKALRILSSLPRRIDEKVWRYDEKGLGITRVFQEALKRARAAYEKEYEGKEEKPDPAFLVNLTFHDLRHEATSRLFELGIFDVTEVSAITGHKTLQMLKRYTHHNPLRLAKKLNSQTQNKEENDLAKRMK
jgi:integrase